MHIYAAGQHDKHVFVLFAWRQEKLARREVAPITAPQQRLNIIRADATEKLKAVEQRALIVRVDGERFLHQAIVARIAIVDCRPAHITRVNYVTILRRKAPFVPLRTLPDLQRRAWGTADQCSASHQ